MNVSQASKIWLEYHRAHSKHNTIRAYQFTIAKFNQHFANQNLKEMSTDDILDFMAKFTEGQTPQTKRIRFSHLTAFINFMGNNFDCDFKNPCDSPKQMIFPICYGAARAMVGKAGKLVGIRLRPHDLRRHAATFASRSNVPLEIISKIILRHSSLKTTEIYLGKVSDTEAIRWIENLLNLTRSEITFDLF